MDNLNPQENPDSRRVAAISVDPRQLLNLIVEGKRFESWTEVQFDGIPEGAVVVGHGHNLISNCFILLIRHDSFEVVPLGAQPPLLVGRLEARREQAKDRLIIPNLGAAGRA